MAAANLEMQILPIIIAFHASLEAGAVMKTYASEMIAQTIWREAQAARCSKVLLSNHEFPTVKLVAKNSQWTRLMSHTWLKHDNINGLEAAAALLALEGAVRAGVHNQRLVLLIESLVVLGALQKGRSSFPALLDRCRRFAATALAHNIEVVMAYVKSENNPADLYTRTRR